MKSIRHYPVSKPRAVTRRYDLCGVDADVEGNSDNIESLGDNQVILDPIAYDFNDPSFTIERLNPQNIKKFYNLEAYPYAFETDYDVLCWVSAILTESPMGLALLQNAQDKDWKIALSDLNTGGFHLEIDQKTIYLDHFGFEPAAIGQSTFYRLSLIPILTKALRDIMHEDKFGAFEETYSPENTVQLERVRAADTDSIAVMVGWELRAVGYDDVWRHVLSSDDGDMAQVMVNVIERYPTSQYNGMAVAHVFRQWFADTNRLDAVDHDTLERLDDVLHHLKHDLGSEEMNAALILSMSQLFDGTHYLQDLAEIVAKDSFFVGFNDSINQAHLFQIIYDSKVTYVKDIPFRDRLLAEKFLNA